MNQGSKNKQLLDITMDCLQFVTRFFEVISVSIPHIYHSALELCPTSSIIRRLYYHQCTNHSPKVIFGTPEFWAQTIAISGKDCYIGLCIWSPCGQFVAAQTRKAVEIRNQLTLELITTLQPTEPTSHLVGPLAYSPDGRSIACASNIAIVIWDIQTGGVAREIECSPIDISLVWSLDGQTICTISSGDQAIFVVCTYSVSSGTAISSGTVQSGDNPHLWVDNNFFWVMTTTLGIYHHDTIDIFRVESTLTKIQSFSLIPMYNVRVRSFSPTTYHVSISNDLTLRIWDIQDAGSFSVTSGYFLSHCFSLDGSFFAASKKNSVYIWKNASNCYIPWRKFHSQDWSNSPLQFSPTSSSITSYSGNILQVLRVHELPAGLGEYSHQYVGLSHSCAYIATAKNIVDRDRYRGAVEITNILTKAPLQLIGTDMHADGLVLTGNVLLVTDSQELKAWLLGEEGLVDGVNSDGQIHYGNYIWTIHLPQPHSDSWMLLVKGQVGVIKKDGNTLHVYHIGTGEVLHSTQVPQHSSSDLYHFSEVLHGRHYHYCHNLPPDITSPKYGWQATLQEGWVKDSEGKHWLWVPAEWRKDWNPAGWRQDITTHINLVGGKYVIIKF